MHPWSDRLRRAANVAVLLTASALAACAVSQEGGFAAAPSVAAVETVLDDFHAAASEADGARYFDHFAPDGVFLGTDDTERWTVEEFRAYALPYFSEGRGWTYRPSARHVIFSDDGRTAWFDEKLDNEKYGRVRGTGVLRLVDGEWKLAHYSLSFPIPNEVTVDAVALIREWAGATESGD